MKPTQEHCPAKRQGSGSEAGGTLVIAILTIAILAMIAANVFISIGARYNTTFHSSSWQEAMYAAEMGVDTAVASLNMTINNPPEAWTGWTSGTTAATWKTYKGTITKSSGEGGASLYTSVTIEQYPLNGTTWYRIRSHGTAQIPGSPRAGEEASLLTTGTVAVKNHLSLLRKLSLRTDKTAGALSAPQVSRHVEVMVSPATVKIFQHGLSVQNWVSMSGGAFVDSFDSSNPAKSTNGQYDLLKRQLHGDIAINASGGSSDLRGAYVYGDVDSNTGTVKNTSHVQGSVHNNFSTTFPAVSDPVGWTIQASPTVINNPGAPVTLVAGTQASPKSYKLSTLTVSNGANPVILAPPVAGQESYIQIWVTGKTTTSGSGYVQVQPGVHVTFYCDDDITISGGGFVNQNSTAAYMSIFGVTPSNGSNKFTDSGSADFVGTFYGPSFDATISGSGSYSGSLVGNSATISGGGGFHFDEALDGMSGGDNSAFQVSSWIEDIR